MPSNTYASQELIIAVLKEKDIDLDEFFEDYDLSSYDLINELWEVEEYEELYQIDLAPYLDTHDIYIVYFRGIENQDIWEIGDKYLSGVTGDNLDDLEDVYNAYAEDWFEFQGKVVEYIKINASDSVIILYFNQEIQTE